MAGAPAVFLLSLAGFRHVPSRPWAWAALIASTLQFALVASVALALTTSL